MKAKMPTSRAKTAYGLLSEVRALILEEPKRYNQFDVLSRGEDLRYLAGEDRPACGTIGCVAGWVAVLRSPRSRNAINAAQRILHLRDDQLEELVNMQAAGSRSDFRAHAKRGAEHIVAFQKKYAKQLKAKRV